MVLRMGRDDTTMTVQAPRQVWEVIRLRASVAGRDDLVSLIDEAVAAEPADKQSIRITAATDEAAALYELSAPNEEGE